MALALPATLADVKKILEIDAKIDDADLQCFVDHANAWIEGLGIEDADCMSDSLTHLVAVYVAAHFITIRDRRVTETETDDTRDRYESSIGQGLEGSSYGQQAKRFDCSGILANIDSNNDASTGTKPTHIFETCGR